jgi:hypothetical protein
MVIAAMVPTNPMNEQDQSAKGGVHRLVVLPFWKSVEISLKSIQVRFFRSLITTMSLVLAIAFLAFVNISNHVANGLLASGDTVLRQAISRSGYDIDPATNRIDQSAKQRWLVILSLLVCVVGIVNAQLMAVTERFREIGTMKCLGALDRFVLRLFLLEASIQGFIGALVGSLLGGLFAILSGALRFGFLSLTSLNWSAIGLSILMATCVGSILSLLGVLYPALIASRMQPVEAMRVEQ